MYSCPRGRESRLLSLLTESFCELVLRDLRASPETSRKLLIIRDGNWKFPALWTRQRQADTLW